MIEKLKWFAGFKDENKRVKRLAWFFVYFGAGAFIYGFIVAYNQNDGLTLANLAACGSWLQGAVASLWSLAALLFIYATLIAQEKQIRTQELELSDQKNTSKQQLHSIQLQNFENSFYAMLNLLQGIVSQMDDNSEYRTSGRDCFKKWRTKLEKYVVEKFLRVQALNSLHGIPYSDSNPVSYEITLLAYDDFYVGTQEHLGHYFRTLYHLIKMVSNSPVLRTDAERKRYVSIVRAQLSAYELVLLYYNCVRPVADKFRDYVIQYDLFEHLDNKLLLQECHKDFLVKVMMDDVSHRTQNNQIRLLPN